MYTRYYGLRELPFGITPDTGYFFAHRSQREALNTLLAALRMGEGFLKVVGEVGTGKTLLCRKVLAVLATDPHVTTAYIPNPYLEPGALLAALASEIGLEDISDHPHTLLKHLTARLINISAAGGRVVLFLDEAQAMPIETLEAVRLISNLETEKRKLIQIVLFGQPELDDRLADPAIRQLRQRISFSCRLAPLTFDDLDSYLRHRLQVAGFDGPALFTKAAVRALHRASGGIPRLVNILAHKALMAAYGEGAAAVTHRHVKAACADTESVRRVRWWPHFVMGGRR